jgi:hypothetical protein
MRWSCLVRSGRRRQSESNATTQSDNNTTSEQFGCLRFEIQDSGFEVRDPGYLESVLTTPSRYGCIYDNYTSLWNVLDYCGTTLPVTSVSTVVDEKPAYCPRNEVEARVWDGCEWQPLLNSVLAPRQGRRGIGWWANFNQIRRTSR